jgi:hypothetical protein
VLNGVAVSGLYAYCATGTGLGIFQYYGAGIEERPAPDEPRIAPAATIVRNVLLLPASGVERQASSVLLDISGRKVLDLAPGANDVSRLAPGVYFVRETQAQAIRKVLVLK